MNNFLQSSIWKTIKTKIYHESSTTVHLFENEYFGLIKTKKVGPFSLSWLQILGVELPLQDSLVVQQELKRIAYRYQQQHKSTVFIQLGIVNELSRFPNQGGLNNEGALAKRKEREHLEQKLRSQYRLHPSFRENMPLSSIIISVAHQTDSSLLERMESSTLRHIKKAFKQQLHFREALVDDYKTFYDHWKSISQEKGFSIITWESFQDLMDYLQSNQCGQLLIVEKSGQMLAGSIVVFKDTTLVYLYGFSNRDPVFRNSGAHHFLRYKTLCRARDHGYKQVDLFGGSPSGYPHHSLVGVSRFKESFGGEKVEYYGNYDIVLRPLLYLLIKIRYYTTRR